MLNLPRTIVTSFNHFSLYICKYPSSFMWLATPSPLFSVTTKANLCIVNEDHPQCNVPRKARKACQAKDRGALLLREWPLRPFSSTGLGSPCEFVYCRHNTGSRRGPGSASIRHLYIALCVYHLKSDLFPPSPYIWAPLPFTTLPPSLG